MRIVQKHFALSETIGQRKSPVAMTYYPHLGIHRILTLKIGTPNFADM